MTTVRRLALVLCVIGALNWGHEQSGQHDLDAEIFGMEFGETNAATRVIYGLVGLSGVVHHVTELAIAQRSVRDQPAGVH